MLVASFLSRRRMAASGFASTDVTIKDAYPLPRIDESLDLLAESRWFSCLDMNS